MQLDFRIRQYHTILHFWMSNPQRDEGIECRNFHILHRERQKRWCIAQSMGGHFQANQNEAYTLVPFDSSSVVGQSCWAVCTLETVQPSELCRKQQCHFLEILRDLPEVAFRRATRLEAAFLKESANMHDVQKNDW